MDSWYRSPRDGDPERMLSLDGGGVRGFSSLWVLNSFMHAVASEENQPVRRLQSFPEPFDHFDMFCGTSTGGIVAMQLAHLGSHLDSQTQDGRYMRHLDILAIESCPDNSNCNDIFDPFAISPHAGYTNNLPLDTLGGCNLDVPLVECRAELDLDRSFQACRDKNEWYCSMCGPQRMTEDRCLRIYNDKLHACDNACNRMSRSATNDTCEASPPCDSMLRQRWANE